MKIMKKNGNNEKTRSSIIVYELSSFVCLYECVSVCLCYGDDVGVSAVTDTSDVCFSSHLRCLQQKNWLIKSVLRRDGGRVSF